MRVELIDCYLPDDSRWWGSWRNVREPEDAPVFEDRWYSLALYEYDRTGEYRVFVGDEELKLESREFTNSLEFARGVYFESASGATELSVVQTRDGADETVFRASLYVVPSKIGWANYKGMVSDLQSVCRALVTDVRGKSSAGRGEAARAWRTLEEELLAVSGACRRLKPILAEIERSPKAAMTVRQTTVPAGRARSRRAVAAMMKRGIDPTAEGAESRLCVVGRLVESRDIPEHRLIKAFLRLMRVRLASCRAGLAADVRRLEAEGKYRSRTSVAGERSLYETEDVPRIRRLKERNAEAEDIQRWLDGELGGGFWAGVGEAVFAPESTQFAENDYYLEAANIVLRYLRDLSHWGGTFGSPFRAKKNSRMYEQWVLVQLVAAFAECGLEVTTWDEVLGRSVGASFGVDFARNTTFAAKLCEGCEVVIRYEPWILPKDASWKFPSESLCHFGGGNWSPDIVIELRGAKGQALYALAMDAKYSRRPTKEMRESVLKYARIRTTEGRFGRRVARQVWLVYPGDGSRRRTFWLDDEAMYFSPNAGVAYRDTNVPVEPVEQVFGELVALPSERSEASAEANGVGLRPKKAFLDFASGTLAYFRQLAEAQKIDGVQ